MLLSKLLADSNIEHSLHLHCKGGKTDLLHLDIREIFCDSRKVVEGGLYIALDGLHTDSHAFIGDACRHGAVAAIVSRSAVDGGRVATWELDIPLVAVDDCREAMSRIYAAWYGNAQRDMTFIGVTGTNGKTTVTRMIFEVLSRSGFVCGLIGTAGNYISFCSGGEPRRERVDIKSEDPLANMTTPDPDALYRMLAYMKERGVRYVVMEVTSHALYFKKVAPICFEVGVFTNLSEDHLDLHGDMEEYYRVKKSFFDLCRRCVINIDDKYGRRLAAETEIKKYTVSAEERAADICACDIKCHGEGGMEYRLSSRRMRLRIKTKIPGAITVINTLEAAAVCSILCVAPRDIKDSILSLEGIRGRLERLKLPVRVGFSVYIDYAHTPDALENLLRTAKMFAKKGQRIVLLFGCGGDRERQKRAIMGHIASDMADMFVITSDNPRGEEPEDIINDIISGVNEGAQYTVISDRQRAIEYVISTARQGDIILLAGKGHEEYYIDKSGRHGFSERDIVEAAVKRYHG